MKNVLVTGGSGFVGRSIVAALSGRYRVLAPGRAEVDFTDDAAVDAFFKKSDIDVIIHAATRPGHRNAADPTGVLYANTRMFLNLARNAARVERFILLGSGSEYDVRRNLSRVPEDAFGASLPLDEGGLSKYVASAYMERFPGQMVNLRLFGVFGAHEDWTIRFISNAICKTLFDLPITLRQNRRFDYLFADDLMPVLEHCIENPMRHTAYNVTPDRSVELLELAELVRARSGKDLEVLVAQPGMGLEYTGDNARLHRELPGLSFTPMVEAVDRLYRWYQENIGLIAREKLLQDK
ncbi:NAD(P)-dependent oxidoreductase [Geomonas terrae]|uniref:NAD(P)-dependent oxidoreductase n=1 Tax=Geomonas terrae TaxID=2562681 RepID=A0A4V3NZ23_9BACT|nr:NAD(P)-dependent oxidoreductase [Geomonas terrae]TGU70052.1 NAD(P)-dependent oxidoreductase [Geomonas terrae]